MDRGNLMVTAVMVKEATVKVVADVQRPNLNHVLVLVQLTFLVLVLKDALKDANKEYDNFRSTDL